MDLASYEIRVLVSTYRLKLISAIRRPLQWIEAVVISRPRHCRCTNYDDTILSNLLSLCAISLLLLVFHSGAVVQIRL